MFGVLHKYERSCCYMENTVYMNRYQEWLDFEELLPELREELEQIKRKRPVFNVV